MSVYANPLTEYSPQTETFEFSPEMEYEGESSGSVFSEQEEMDLAAELLEVNNEQELEQFLGNLIKGVGRAIGSVVKSPIGRAIGGALKGVAKAALPIAGGALGTFVGGPIGTALGSSLGSMAGQALGLELEGLSQEDREFEATKQFVRFASEAAKNALQAPPGCQDPASVAHAAVTDAARIHAPGLMQAIGAAPVPPAAPKPSGGASVRVPVSTPPTQQLAQPRGARTRSGRWIRHHGKIVVLDV
jgi:uncharacterized protein (DUF697 family)